jgi:hypothetical protein
MMTVQEIVLSSKSLWKKQVKFNTVNSWLSDIKASELLLQPGKISKKFYNFYEVTSKTNLLCSPRHVVVVAALLFVFPYTRTGAITVEAS